MRSSVKGRFHSGGTVPVELVVFEVPNGHHLDHGVSNALFAQLMSQYTAAAVTRLAFERDFSDYNTALSENCRNVFVGSDTGNGDNLWEVVLSDEESAPGNRLVVIDGLYLMIERYTLQSLSLLLHGARVSGGRVIFISMLHRDDFDSAIVDALCSLSSTIVRVRQVFGANASTCASGGQVWNDLKIQVSRRKLSGRVNVDDLECRFDESKNTLEDIKVVGPRNVESNGSKSGEDGHGLSLNVPFKMELSKEEKEARAAVQLPYVHQEAFVADRALILHPPELQVRSTSAGNGSSSSESGSDSSSGEDSILVDDYGENLFSEDV